MANMKWETIKINNGRIDATVPDLKVGDAFLFRGESPKTTQYNIMTDIFTYPNCENIIIQHRPEFTPVCNEGMFKHGKIKFKVRK